MVWVPLANGSGQVVKGIKLKDPYGNTWEVVDNKRLGINRYRIYLRGKDGTACKTTNTEIRRTHQRAGWQLVGRWHTPKELADMFNRPIDPDANEPRPNRETFWRMVSKPGTHNYKQKVRLMKEPYYVAKFGHLFKTTISG